MSLLRSIFIDEPWLSRAQPWSTLRFTEQVARVGRILAGLLLFSFFAWLLVMVVFGIPLIHSPAQMAFAIGVIPYLGVLLWCIARIFIFRPVHRPSAPPAGAPPEPPNPPDAGAPRLAPLRPVAPLILSAHAEIPREDAA